MNLELFEICKKDPSLVRIGTICFGDLPDYKVQLIDNILKVSDKHYDPCYICRASVVSAPKTFDIKSGDELVINIHEDCSWKVAVEVEGFEL